MSGCQQLYEQSVSAAHGGVTMFMDFANMGKGIPHLHKRGKSRGDGRIGIDYSVHGKLWSPRRRRLLTSKKMAEYGIPTFKMFMTYKKEGVMSDDETMLKVFEKAKSVNGLLWFTASNAIAETNIEKSVGKKTI